MTFTISFSQEGIASLSNDKTPISDQAADAVLSGDSIQGSVKNLATGFSADYLKQEALSGMVQAHNSVAKPHFENPHNPASKADFENSKTRLQDKVSFLNSFGDDPWESLMVPLDEAAYTQGLASLDEYADVLSLDEAQQLNITKSVLNYLSKLGLKVTPENIDFALENLQTPEANLIKGCVIDGNCGGSKPTDPSRPGDLHPDPLSNPSPRGSAIDEIRPGFSVPSPSGYAGRGILDEEGPAGSSSAAGAANAAAQRAYDAAHGLANNGGEGAANNGHGGTGNRGGQTGSGLGDNTTGAGPGFNNNSTPTSGTGPQHAPPSNPGPKGGKSTPKGPGEISDSKQIGAQPILLDLNGNGVQIADLSESTQFIDAGGDGLRHRSAWAAAGDGVLFLDADGDGKISDRREYVFTDWAPGAGDDMEALRAAFDSNGDGKLTAADARFNEFKAMVTGADGATTVQTLAQLGITEINLRPDATRILLPDGSAITGQSTFVMGGVTRTVANVTLVAEAQGYRVVEAVPLARASC